MHADELKEKESQRAKDLKEKSDAEKERRDHDKEKSEEKHKKDDKERSESRISVLMGRKRGKV
jgi:dual specificity tyrosine-phosphorylation-regulated kinase 2/3/4